MSIKVWARNNETGEVMHVNSIDKSYKGKMVCLDEHCNEVLNICMGEKKKPYFSHSKNCSCNGGGVETLLHLLARQILSKCQRFILPEESIIFRGKKLIFNPKRTIIVREVILGELRENGFKTGIKLIDMLGEVYYIEASIRGVSASRKNAYSKHNANLIEVDLRKFSGNENFDEAELTEFICGEKGVKSFVCSPNIDRVENLIKKAEFTANGEYIACPARMYEQIVEKKKCSKCPFFMYSRDGVITCAGKGYFSEVVDFRIVDKELRFEKYVDVLPEPIWAVDKFAMLHPFGVCEKCNTPNEIAVSERNISIAGIIRLVRNDNSYAYIYCPACGNLQPITCPVCGEKMKVCVNKRTKSVFLSCDSYIRGGSGCNTTLTLFTAEPCIKNYSDELLAVKSIQNFLKNFKRCDKTIMALRENFNK